MNAKEWEAWLKRNAPIAGMPRSYDPYNQSKKGKARISVPEYASMNVEERHSYSENVDLREREEDKEEKKTETPTSSSSSSKKQGSNKARSSTRSVGRSLGNVVAKVVVAAGGSVAVVTGYQTIIANEASKPPLVAVATWTWADDNLSASAKLYDSENIYLKELEATVVDVTTEATCTKDGDITYTATIKDDDDSVYTDQHIVVLPALGHVHDEGREETLENGDHVIIYECTRCHETFTITISQAEEEI